jgi:hypothetical protein
VDFAHEVFLPRTKADERRLNQKPEKQKGANGHSKYEVGCGFWLEQASSLQADN